MLITVSQPALDFGVVNIQCLHSATSAPNSPASPASAFGRGLIRSPDGRTVHTPAELGNGGQGVEVGRPLTPSNRDGDSRFDRQAGILLLQYGVFVVQQVTYQRQEAYLALSHGQEASQCP